LQGLDGGEKQALKAIVAELKREVADVVGGQA
jgi:hypothetical protein